MDCPILFSVPQLFISPRRRCKKELIYFIKLLLSPWRSKTTRKTSFWIGKCINSAHYYKLRRSCYKLRWILQVTSSITNTTEQTS